MRLGRTGSLWHLWIENENEEDEEPEEEQEGEEGIEGKKIGEPIILYKPPQRRMSDYIVREEHDDQDL